MLDLSDPQVQASLWFLLFAASEVIGLSKLRDNSVIQLLLHIIGLIKQSKKLR